MKFGELKDFYQVYDSHRTYVTAGIRKKHIRNYDEQIWYPAALMPNHSVLELGTGTGLFLAYLTAKGIHKFQGVDSDPKVIDYMPKSISKKVIIGDIWKTVDKLNNLFDRIVLLDVFKHFSYFEGYKLLKVLQNQLAVDGKIVIRIPNSASPFGLQYQYNDLTHKAVFGPGSIGHLAEFRVESCILVRRDNGFKRLIKKILLGIVGCMLTEPPPPWGANMVVVLTPQNQN